MNFEELLEKYALMIENDNLREEIKSLKAHLVIEESQGVYHETFEHKAEPEVFCSEPDDQYLQSTINNMSDSMEKIKLYMSLFRGRDDVYAKRWENGRKGTYGYSPACTNEWKPGICQKAKIKCANCKYKDYLGLNVKVIDDHLRGRGNLVVGIYPMCIDETCYFLAIDFDEGEWKKDISVLREVCAEFKILAAVERSRSGKGTHAWFFFNSPLAASLARKFGSALLTYSMNKRQRARGGSLLDRQNQLR